MLPQKHRLPLRTELVHVQKEGKLFQGRLFSLLLAHQSLAVSHPALPSRFAFIISTKIHKRATKRNRARRLLSEAIREFLPEIKPGYDGIFLAKKPIVEADYQEIAREVAALLKKAQLI